MLEGGRLAVVGVRRTDEGMRGAVKLRVAIRRGVDGRGIFGGLGEGSGEDVLEDFEDLLLLSVVEGVARTYT
jgi:hypothetical protein